MSAHVMPVNDFVSHDADPDCVCNPTLDDNVWIHHSLDNRESEEQQ